MADTHVISALVKKRAELLGDIEHCENIIKEFRLNLITIDKAIIIFDVDYDISNVKPIRRKKSMFFNNGEAKVLVLETLKNSKMPISTDKITDILASKKDIEFKNKIERASFQKSVLFALNTCLSNNLVEKVSKDGLTIIWKIKELN